MNRKTGIVFGGGGGRGAYQVGVWKAVRESGLEQKISAVSGCSVGALTAIMFNQGDYDFLYEIWSTLKNDTIVLPKYKTLSVSKDIRALSKRIQPARSGSLAACSWLGLLETLRQYCDYGRMLESPMELYVAVTNIMNEKGRAEHFKAFRKFFTGKQFGQPWYISKSEMKSENDLYNALIASCAIPGVYPALLIDGKQYYDGGLWETHPIKPLADAGCTDVLVVSLYNREPSNMGQFAESGCRCRLIRPAKSFGNFREATLDFDSEHFRYKFDLGYSDALPVVEQMMKDLL